MLLGRAFCSEELAVGMVMSDKKVI